MTKNIRVYTDPNNSVQFMRFSAFNDAIFTASSTAGVFAPDKPNIKLFNGQSGWALHITGCWGRVVVTGSNELLDKAKAFRKEALS